MAKQSLTQRCWLLVMVAVGFWATICKMLRPMLWDHFLSCLSVLSACLSVILVHHGKTIGWFTMPLGMEVGLSPGDIVVDEDPAPPTEKDTAALPHFLAHIYCGQTVAHLSNCCALVI